MALEILKNTKTLTLEGTNITFPSIYSRLELRCFEDGKLMKATFFNYQSKESYTSGESKIKVKELPGIGNYSVDVVAGEEQSLTLAHDKAKADLEALGYTVNIIDLPV